LVAYRLIRFEGFYSDLNEEHESGEVTGTGNPKLEVKLM
jgi:hypothetical protein